MWPVRSVIHASLLPSARLTVTKVARRSWTTMCRRDSVSSKSCGRLSSARSKLRRNSVARANEASGLPSERSQAALVVLPCNYQPSAISTRRCLKKKRSPPIPHAIAPSSELPWSSMAGRSPITFAAPSFPSSIKRLKLRRL